MGLVGLGAQANAQGAVAADLDQLGYQVNRDNVLHVYGVLAAEAERMHAVMDQYGAQLYIDLCGGDPVSRDAQRGFNEKLSALRDQCQGYVTALAAAADRLKQTALAYGYTEEDIKASFSAGKREQHAASAAHPPSPALNEGSVPPPSPGGNR